MHVACSSGRAPRSRPVGTAPARERTGRPERSSSYIPESRNAGSRGRPLTASPPQRSARAAAIARRSTAAQREDCARLKIGILDPLVDPRPAATAAPRPAATAAPPAVLLPVGMVLLRRGL